MSDELASRLEEDGQDTGPSVVPPDPRVRLSFEQYSEVVDHINRKAVTPDDGCPVCGSPNNQVTVDVYKASVLTKTPLPVTEYQPLLSTVCNNCGFVRFFNSLVVNGQIEKHKSELESVTESEVPNGS